MNASKNRPMTNCGNGHSPFPEIPRDFSAARYHRWILLSRRNFSIVPSLSFLGRHPSSTRAPVQRQPNVPALEDTAVITANPPLSVPPRAPPLRDAAAHLDRATIRPVAEFAGKTRRTFRGGQRRPAEARGGEDTKRGGTVLLVFSPGSSSSGVPSANVKSTEHSNVTGEPAQSNRITDLSRCSALLFLHGLPSPFHPFSCSRWNFKPR